MYLRHSRIRKDGKTHTYWRLVRSVRRHGKVVQETVAQLGELDAEGLPQGREAVPWSVMAAVLVIARRCEPSIELHIAED